MPYTNYFLIYIFKQHLDQAFSLLKAIGVNHIFVHNIFMHLIESFCLQTDEFIIVPFKRTETSGVLNRKTKKYSYYKFYFWKQKNQSSIFVNTKGVQCTNHTL